jgi:glc operon protein GlcG
MMATDCVQDFNIKTVYPYNEFMSNRKLGGGGWVRKLSANKDIVVQELMRRDSNAKPNKSNRSCEELLRLFKPLTDRRDIDFVIKKELEIRQKLEAMLGELNNKRVGQDVKEKTPKRPKIEKKVEQAEPVADVHIQLKLTDSVASIAMDAAEKTARENGCKVTIAIVNAEGVPMLVKRLEGANPHSFDLAITKAKTSCHFQRNSSQLQDFPDISRGGVPFMANGICIGGIGVSGDKQPNCEKVAYAAVDKLVEVAKQESLNLKTNQYVASDVVTVTTV